MEFLLYWSTPAQVAFVVIVFGGGSVAGLYLVRRLVPLDRLQMNHEVAAVTFGALGAFYGLVLAFVIVAAWEQFNQANAQTREEATALFNVYKLGAAFPAPLNAQVDGAVLEYTHRVIDEEWPRMGNMSYQPGKMNILKLWSLLLSYPAPDNRTQMLVDKSIDQLSAVNEARSLRYLFYDNDLPSVVWLIIYLGGLMTIGFSYFFGSNVFRAQAMMCAFFSIMLGMTILAILELAHPYQGTVTITDEPFRWSLMQMKEVSNFKMAP